MKKIYSVDRIEGDIAVLVCDDGEVLDVRRSVIGELLETDVFSAELEGGELTNVIPMPEEKQRRLDRARERIERLKNRK